MSTSKTPPAVPARLTLPAQGKTPAEILAELAALRESDARWQEGRTFSLVYHAGDEHNELLRQAYGLFLSENALNPMAFPSLRRMENEVVAMALGILGASVESGACGTMSSGGTESIMLAVKAYRDQARAQGKGLDRAAPPEMILATTAHPAFMKAAHFLDVKPVVVPVGSDFRMDVEAARAAISERTLFLVGSAPAYPQGVVDPIVELAALAAERGLGMHVDACVGGFLLPFVRKAGYPMPPFDFSVPGVTSMSADLHKYGFAAKGASTVLYRSAELRRHQFFQYTEWPGGLFGSSTVLGTRPGGAIAAAWATLSSLGEAGYVSKARQMMTTAQAFLRGIEKIPGLRILGAPVATVFAFTSDTGNIFAIADQMEQRGWHIDRQQRPDAIHLMITPAHAAVVDRYLADLASSAAYVASHPETATEGAAAMYGMLALLPERASVEGFILQNLDALYRPT